MKNKIITAMFYLSAAGLLVVGPHTIFAVCHVGDTAMKCHWSVRAEIGVALILAVTAVLYLLSQTAREKSILSGIATSSSAVAILIPKVLIGGCSMKTMACQALTFPAIYTISGFLIIYSLSNVLYLRREEKNLARIKRLQTAE